MKEHVILQDNRITMARYELSLIEKRIMYIIIKEIRQKYVLANDGQKDLFGDLVLTLKSSDLVKEVYEDNKKAVKNALRTLRSRSFEYEDEESDYWFETGFINYGEWNNGVVEVQVSKKILPFFVELTRTYTEYSLSVAMSLKSKWSQRLYELCSKWKNAGGFVITVDELREAFKLEDKYEKFGAFRSRVLEVAKEEIKDLYDKGQCDLYFNYSELKEGRKIESLRFKIVSDNKNEDAKLSNDDYVYFIRTKLSELFTVSMYPKNKSFVDSVLRYMVLNPDFLKPCYDKILFVYDKLPEDERAKYMRYVIKAEKWNDEV